MKDERVCGIYARQTPSATVCNRELFKLITLAREPHKLCFAEFTLKALSTRNFIKFNYRALVWTRAEKLSAIKVEKYRASVMLDDIDDVREKKV